MKPLFPFYGSKWRDAKRYAPPHNGRVVEPFAGSAGYSVYYEPEKVILYDKDPILVGVWDYLIHVTPEEIRALPDLAPGQSVDEFSQLPQEARWLIGFWLNRGSSSPKKTQTAFSSRTERQQLVWSERARLRVASQLDKIRHWKIHHGSYEDAPSEEATYFIDPPYLTKGKYYRFHDIDYAHLSSWCKRLPHPAIVCEQAGASWLPFIPLATIKSTRGISSEVLWTNKDSHDQEKARQEDIHKQAAMRPSQENPEVRASQTRNALP